VGLANYVEGSLRATAVLRQPKPIQIYATNFNDEIPPCKRSH
jgi:hypothetical protein